MQSLLWWRWRLYEVLWCVLEHKLPQEEVCVGIDLAALSLFVCTLSWFTRLLTLHPLNILGIAFLTFNLRSLLLRRETPHIANRMNLVFYNTYLSLLGNKFCSSSSHRDRHTQLNSGNTCVLSLPKAVQTIEKEVRGDQDVFRRKACEDRKGQKCQKW